MIVTVMGKRWQLVFERGLTRRTGNLGECDPPDKPRKQIRVDASLRGRELLEVLLHEMGHAADWHRDEDAVHDTAADMARAVWRVKNLFTDEH